MITVEELKRIPLFATLADRELEYVAVTVPDIHVAAGDFAVHEGEARALLVVVEGRFAVSKLINGVEQVVGYRLPGTLFGEVPIVVNSPFLASLRAVEASRVIRIEPKVFHTLAAAAPSVSAAVGALALERLGGLKELAQQAPRPELRVIGARGPAVQALRNFLHRNQVEFAWEEAAGEPVVRLADGTTLAAPSIQTVAKAVGLTVAPQQAEYDVVIIGGGPGGMAAAVYGASEGLRTMLIEREAPGGQAGTSSRIENYLGFPFGVSGDELATRALQQARRLGAEIVVTRSVDRLDVAAGTLTLDGGDTLRARTVVLALGVSWRRLAIAGLDRLIGRGVYYGASRGEASAVHGRDVFLVGAGNSAGQAALFFANHARTVTLVVRGDAVAKSMSHYLVQQLRTKANVRIELRSEVVGVHGGEQLEALEIADHAGGVVRRVEAGGLFVFIGADAATAWLPPEIARDARGYVLTGADAAASGLWPAAAGRAPFLLETTALGVFAVGDVRAGSVKRVASAVGDGSLAISLARQHLDALLQERRGAVE